MIVNRKNGKADNVLTKVMIACMSFRDFAETVRHEWIKDHAQVKMDNIMVITLCPLLFQHFLIHKLFLYIVTDVYEKNPFKRVEQTFFFPVLHDQNISVQIIADYLTHMFLNQIYLSIN